MLGRGFGETKDLSVARTALAKRSAAPRRHSSASPKLAKLQSRMAQLASRTRSKVMESETRALTVLTPVAFAMLEKNVNIPMPMDLDPAVVIGGVLAVFGPQAGGRTGKRLEAVGDGLLAFGAGRCAARGSVYKPAGVAGDDDSDGLSGTEILGGE